MAFPSNGGKSKAILLSSIIQTFEAEFLAQYRNSLLPGHQEALAAMQICRTSESPVMLAQCDSCESQLLLPHSCGHRNCPHCQHYESQQWLERQLKKQVPAEYFLLTFTWPEEFRALAWQNQRAVYSIMTRCSWETVKTFTRNDSQLQGDAGATTVLHTHSRRLDYHPHVHLLMPAAAIEPEKRLWRSKRKNQNKSYLFSHKALAKVFRAKILEAIRQEGLDLPASYPEKWVVDVKSVGSGEKALVYLGRYLYRGVIREKDIIACQEGQVIFRYRHGKSQTMRTRTLPGAKFLWLILQHVLPKGFRRARNFGFLHPNSKGLIALLQYLLGLNPKKALTELAKLGKRPQFSCSGCGATMKVVETRIPRARAFDFAFRVPLPVG